VISTEILEHVRDWRRGVSNLKGILKPNGILLLTTRSRGFEYHGYPFDFWRYEVDDMRILFSEFSVEAIESDPEAPGVFVKARKPVPFRERDLKNHELYSMIRHKRCRNIQEFDILFFKFKRMVRRVLSRILPARVKASIKNVICEEKKIS
jgi:SAM-dependent methyltransferase